MIDPSGNMFATPIDSGEGYGIQNPFLPQTTTSTATSPSSTSSDTTVYQQSSKPKMGPKTWFEDEFWPSHVQEFALDTIAVLLALLGPELAPFITAEGVASVLTGVIAFNLYLSFSSGDTAQALGSAIGTTLALLGDMVAGMSWWQQAAFGLAVGGFNVATSLGSAGALQATRMVMAGVVAATLFGGFFVQMGLDYYQYTTSSQ